MTSAGIDVVTMVIVNQDFAMTMVDVCQLFVVHWIDLMFVAAVVDCVVVVLQQLTCHEASHMLIAKLDSMVQVSMVYSDLKARTK
jgi:hypothetical protein